MADTKTTYPDGTTGQGQSGSTGQGGKAGGQGGKAGGQGAEWQSGSGNAGTSGNANAKAEDSR